MFTYLYYYNNKDVLFHSLYFYVFPWNGKINPVGKLTVLNGNFELYILQIIKGVRN